MGAECPSSPFPVLEIMMSVSRTTCNVNDVGVAT